MPVDLMSDCPKNVKITGAYYGSSVPGGTQLRCSAGAHPPPSYQWRNVVDNTTVEGDTFTVSSGKQYNLTCTATTDITYANGTTDTCSNDVYFQVNGTKSPIIKSHTFTRMHV